MTWYVSEQDTRPYDFWCCSLDWSRHGRYGDLITGHCSSRLPKYQHLMGGLAFWTLRRISEHTHSICSAPHWSYPQYETTTVELSGWLHADWLDSLMYAEPLLSTEEEGKVVPYLIDRSPDLLGSNRWRPVSCQFKCTTVSAEDSDHIRCHSSIPKTLIRAVTKCVVDCGFHMQVKPGDVRLWKAGHSSLTWWTRTCWAGMEVQYRRATHAVFSMGRSVPITPWQTYKGRNLLYIKPRISFGPAPFRYLTSLRSFDLWSFSRPYSSSTAQPDSPHIAKVFNICMFRACHWADHPSRVRFWFSPVPFIGGVPKSFRLCPLRHKREDQSIVTDPASGWIATNGWFIK